MVRATVSSVNLSLNKWWSIEKREWTYSSPRDQEMTDRTKNFLSRTEKGANNKELISYLYSLNSLLETYVKNHCEKNKEGFAENKKLIGS
ncbi:MAG: hypothetical protein ACI83B_000050 [Sediminicola sp.]|jgi:hypothetical protein